MIAVRVGEVRANICAGPCDEPVPRDVSPDRKKSRTLHIPVQRRTISSGASGASPGAMMET